MNIMNRLTVKNLRHNKKRTVVTIVGIIISVAMITATSVFFESFIDLFRQTAIQENGDWHARFLRIEAKNLPQLNGRENIRDVMVEKNMGYVKFDAGKSSDHSDLLLKAYNGPATDYFPITLLEGRAPQKENEVVIPATLIGQTGMDLHVGQLLTMQVCERYRVSKGKDGETWEKAGENFGALTPEEIEKSKKQGIGLSEAFVPLYERTYTIVGIAARNQHAAPGYTFFTYLDQSTLAPEDQVSVSVRFRKLSTDIFEQGKALAGRLGADADSCYYHDYLLQYYGVTRYENINDTIRGVAYVIIGIIMIGSIALIYNAFSISVAERSRQLGMLSSVGATKGQKARSVLCEAVLLGLLCIPAGMILGIGIMGTAFWALGAYIVNFTDGVPLRLMVTPWALAAALLFSALTILVSTIRPALRASRMAPIDAIRQTHDIKITRRAVKTSRLTRFVFGFEAELALKNLKRNKRRYRSTVVSLVISIVLFLSVCTFGDYMQRTNGSLTQEFNSSMEFSINHQDVAEADAIIREITQSPLVTGWSVKKQSIPGNAGGGERTAETLVTPKLRSYLSTRDNVPYCTVSVTLLSDESFASYAQTVGVDPAVLMDSSRPSGILVNEIRLKAKGTTVEDSLFSLSAGDTLPVTFDNYKIIDPEKRTVDFYLAAVTGKVPYGGTNSMETAPYATLYVSSATWDYLARSLGEDIVYPWPFTSVALNTGQPQKLRELLREKAQYLEPNAYSLWDHSADQESARQAAVIVNVFAYGFIILITSICIANLFNSISTSISLRRREFAMLKSVGMTPRSFTRMIAFESVFYGIKALLYGLPLSFLAIILLYRVLSGSFYFRFTIPWQSVVVAVSSIFLLVGAIMLYSSAKLKKETIIDALKDENI